MTAHASRSDKKSAQYHIDPGDSCPTHPKTKQEETDPYHAISWLFLDLFGHQLYFNHTQEWEQSVILSGRALQKK